MSSTHILTVFAIFITIFQPPFATSAPDFLAPLVSPVIGRLCKEVGCGKGQCKLSGDFQYECECDPGWKQSLLSNTSALNLKFLPCVIPNCTLNSSCSEAAPPAQSQETPLNASIFEPCSWANCGGGVCNKTSALRYACDCNRGYTNLLNNTAFPCFKECSIGGDCSSLGLTVSNKSATPPPSLADSGSNAACSLPHAALFHGMVVLTISIPPLLTF